MPKHTPVHVGNLATVFSHQFGLLQKLSIVVVRHETDFHALRLVRGLEVAVAGDLAGGALWLFAPWGERAGPFGVGPRGKKEAFGLWRRPAAPWEPARALRGFF